MAPVRPTALVTGAGRGFGRAVALGLVARDWEVLGLVRRPGATLGAVRVLNGDITEETTATIVERALDGRSLDLLVNNAGVDRGGHRLETLEPSVIMDMTAVHAAGAAQVMRAALPALRRADAAQVVNVSSRLGSMRHAAEMRYRDLHQSIAYRMAKAAQNMLTLAAAEALEGSGIAVCAVHPGRLRTDMAAPDADLDVDVAVHRLLEWLASGEDVNRRFYSLDTQDDLPW